MCGHCSIVASVFTMRVFKQGKLLSSFQFPFFFSSNLNINDVLGNYSLTLVDALDTLAVSVRDSQFTQSWGVGAHGSPVAQGPGSITRVCW